MSRQETEIIIGKKIVWMKKISYQYICDVAWK